MATVVRAELSPKNKHWIDKHRYYELKHFCLQYPVWKKSYLALDGMSNRPADLQTFTTNTSNGDPTARCAMAKSFYSDRMKMIERCAVKADRACIFERYSFHNMLRQPRQTGRIIKRRTV